MVWWCSLALKGSVPLSYTSCIYIYNVMYVHVHAWCACAQAPGTSASTSAQFTNSVCSFRWYWVSLSHSGMFITFDLKFTRLLLTSNSGSNKECRPSPRQIRDRINIQDKFLLLEQCSSNKETRLIADIARMVSWPKLWDLALDGCPKYVNALRAFVRIIAHSI